MRAVYKWSLLATVFAPLGLLACADLLGFQRLTFEAPDGSKPQDAPTTTVEPDGAPPPECFSLGLPQKPDVPDRPIEKEMVVALSQFDIGVPDEAGVTRPVGLNLDLACTATRPETTCAIGASDPDFDKYVKDKTRGVDNAGFGLIELLGASYEPLSAKGINQRLREGKFGLVAVIAKYDGTPNDPSVVVRIFPALGVEPRFVDAGSDADATPEPDAAPYFDENDRWVFDRDYAQLEGDDGYTKLVSRDAYVRDGRLVASFESLAVGVSFPNNERALTIRLVEAYLTGTITVIGDKPQIRGGVIAGRWPFAEALASVNELLINVPILPGLTPLCKTPVRDTVKSALCGARDLSASSSLKDPREPCAAFSVGIGFEASPAGFGTGRRPLEAGTVCGDVGLCN